MPVETITADPQKQHPAPPYPTEQQEPPGTEVYHLILHTLVHGERFALQTRRPSEDKAVLKEGV